MRLAGAAAIDGKFLVKIEIIGKNLFYFFGQDRDAASATDVVRTDDKRRLILGRREASSECSSLTRVLT